MSRPQLFAGDTVTVTLQARKRNGAPFTLGGVTVAFTARGGTSVGTLLPVVDLQNGTYTAKYVGQTLGTADTIGATIDGDPVTSAPPTLRVIGFTRISAAGATLVSTQTTTGGYTCGVLTTGDMYCWGISWFGIRGNGTTGSMGPGIEPTLVGGGHAWTDVAAGQYFVCGLAVGGAIYCWGDGDVGQIGNGQSSNPPDVTLPTPTQGSGTFGSISIGVTLGACAVTLTHAARCWGSGNFGRLGNGGDTLVAVPTLVGGAHQFDAVTTGPGGSCGVAAGVAYCWGYFTILGAAAPDSCNGGNACAKTPVAVSGNHTFRPIIALDGNVTCAVADDDATYCWGSGYLGNGTSGYTATPVAVSGGLHFASLSAGDSFHCGIVAGGAAYCWGENKSGRLGNGGTATASEPSPVSGGHAFTQLTSSQDHTCGVTTDGNAFCWGGNDKGELGTRSQVSSLTPVRVKLFAP